MRRFFPYSFKIWTCQTIYKISKYRSDKKLKRNYQFHSLVLTVHMRSFSFASLTLDEVDLCEGHTNLCQYMRFWLTGGVVPTNPS